MLANGRFVGLLKDIGNSSYVTLDASDIPTGPEPGAQSAIDPESGSLSEEGQNAAAADVPEGDAGPSIVPASPAEAKEAEKAKPIFIGHGKDTIPRDKLQKFLSTFQIPYKIAEEEPHLGRPISEKVRQTINQCGSALLIFTRDELFFDKEGKEVWRPSENVVHELGRRFIRLR